MYNFGVFLANNASEENSRRKRNPDKKYQYEVNFFRALSTARDCFLRSPEDESDISPYAVDIVPKMTYVNS